MSEKIKECWNCGWYRAYYTKGFCQFDKQKVGYCRKHDITIDDKHETCDYWGSNYSLRRLRKKVALRKLNLILDSIVQIKQILFEDKQEELQTEDNDTNNI